MVHLLIAGLICAVMLIWRKASIIRSHYVTYCSINDYTDIISDVKADGEIPKFASNVIYFSRSQTPCEVESKLVYSIINKHPKRADHYWIIRVVFTDTPDTLEYERTVLIEDTLISLEMRIGFRIQPQVTVYLRQAVEDLVGEGMLDLTSSYPSLRRHGIAGDFRFIMIRRLFSPSSSCSARERMLMNLYELLRKMELKTEDAFGLDTSNVKVENVPLIINNRVGQRIRLVDSAGDACQ